MMQKVHFRSTSIAQKRSCSTETTTPYQQRPSFASLTFSENNEGILIEMAEERTLYPV